MTDNLTDAVRECIQDGLHRLRTRRQLGAQQEAHGQCQEVSLEECAGYMIRGGYSHTDQH